MKPLKYYLLSFLLLSSFSQVSAVLPMPINQEIIVNNRILTTINGKTISVLDVMKQMDVFLSQYYPQYLDSTPARLQFYSTQWRHTLQRMIDQELMMADAESRQIKTTDAEVREEIQNRYGPNVMGSLDKLGITYEEAKEMVRRDLVVQKIQWFRVTSKVLPKVTTEMTKRAYDDYLKKNPPKETWAYQFLTFRYDSVEMALAHAQQIKALQERSKKSLSTAVDLFKEKLPEAEKNCLTLSAEFELEDKDLSSTHRDVLTKLSPGAWSDPIAQQSRDGSQVVRIFQLKSHTKQETPLFETIANGLKQELLNKYADAEMEVYLSRLHQRFGYDQNSLNVPPHFEPFSF